MVPSAVFVPAEIYMDPLTYVHSTFGSEPIRIFTCDEHEGWVVVTVASGLATMEEGFRAAEKYDL